MSQYDNPYAQQSYDPGFAEPPKTSGLAITSLICAFILPPIGVLLSIAAMMSIKKNAPRVKGMGMAVAGLIIGIIMSFVCAGCIGFSVWGYKVYQQMMAAATEWPQETMDAGYAGDYAGFREHLMGTAAAGTDEEVQAFLDALEARYGEYVKTNPMPANQPPQAAPGQTLIPINITIEFTNETVDATFYFQMIDANTGTMDFGYEELVIHDSDDGDITYPAGN